METFAEYGHALLSLALYGVLVGLLSALAGIRKSSLKMVPGAPIPPDYDNPSYRLDRSFMNAMENVGAFAAVTVAAILAGVSPALVNWAASLVLVFRLIYVFCYARKIGAPYGGVRTVLAVLSFVAVAVMAVATALEVF